MPEEIFILSVVAILAGSVVVLAVVWAILSFFRSRSKPAVSGDSLTASELQELVRAAAAEAVLPLERKVEALEERLERRALPPLSEEPERLEGARSERPRRSEP